MKAANYLIIATLFFSFVGCSDADNSSVLAGKWLATSAISRKSCDNIILNGDVNCFNDVGSGNTHSCVELSLNSLGTYILYINDGVNVTNEAGNYEPSSGNIRLCPTEPQLGICYNLPISSADYDNMTIELPRDGGCILTIPMIKTDLE